MDPNNPFKVECPHETGSKNQIDFEYVPIMPLSWRTDTNTNTECAVGGQNCGKIDQKSKCSVASLAFDMLQYASILEKRKAMKIIKNDLQQFSVVSTYNFRTALGYGMPSQKRKGPGWQSMSKFTMDMMLGSYERISLCPDLLRKPFKHTVEIPYVPLSVAEIDETTKKFYNKETERIYNFYFSGQIKLWGSERICTPRSILPSIALEPGVRLVNDTHGTSRSEIQKDRIEEMKMSKFCLILKANSYSTGSFYTAIQADCIPVVVSDWFFFAFPNSIDYSKFVIRIQEETFLMNPAKVLNKILVLYDSSKRIEMREAMYQYAAKLSYSNHASKKFIFDNMLSEMMSINLAGKDGWAMISGCQKNNPTLCPPSIYVSPLNLLGALDDTRSYFCKNAKRLVGYYKLVLYAQCTRIFWPLRPGNFIREDRISLKLQEIDFIWKYHNLSSNTPLNWKDTWAVYPFPKSDELKKIQSL